MTVAIESYDISVADSALDDLQERLAWTRYPTQIAGIEWEQGTELDYLVELVELVEHWRTRYDWRATEHRLGAYEHLAATVDAQRIHVLHARSANADAIPLLLVHGWPGSVMEFLDALPLLTETFHVVAPSLPGFTFSGPTHERGWHPRRIAGAFADIMEGLGYERYGLQGGDWGSLIAANVADLRPERSIGLHLNMVSAARPVDGAPITDAERAQHEAMKQWRRTGVGYQEIQGTRPQSLGYALEDSPAGLAGWIIEKFREWSDGDIRDAFSFDRLLDNIAAYWLTGTATSSLRIYWEMRRAGAAAAPAARIEVPTAVAQFPGELGYPPRSWVDAAYNVTRWSTPARGGHFAAMEAPDVFAADVREFFTSL